jgi:hypothetical protein
METTHGWVFSWFLHKGNTLMNQTAARGRQPIPATSIVKPARKIAELVLRVLDNKEYRSGKRAIEYRDSFSDDGEGEKQGVIRIQRGKNGRVYFQTPRNPEMSVRLEPTKSKSLLANRNVQTLQSWLENNPLVLSFLDSNKLRGS